MHICLFVHLLSPFYPVGKLDCQRKKKIAWTDITDFDRTSFIDFITLS